MDRMSALTFLYTINNITLLSLYVRLQFNKHSNDW